MIEVLKATWWEVYRGGSWAGSSGGSTGQLTKCKLNGVIFYVRENVGGIDRFLTSSSARLGMKKGENPHGSFQALDLCAPKEKWEEIAAAVRAEDTMKRPVRHHLQFTVDWAEDKLREGG